MSDGDDRTPQERAGEDVRVSGPPGGPAGPPAGAERCLHGHLWSERCLICKREPGEGAHALDVDPPQCELCGRAMVRGTGDGKDLGPIGPVWLCNGGPGKDRHRWVARERKAASGAALQELVDEADARDPGVVTPEGIQAAADAVRRRDLDPGEADGVDEPCDHSNTPFPERPVADAWYVCPDCGQRVGRRGGEIITVEENNRRASAAARAKQVQVDSVFQARERMRAMLTRRGIRLHDDVLDELAQITSPPGVHVDGAVVIAEMREEVAAHRDRNPSAIPYMGEWANRVAGWADRLDVTVQRDDEERGRAARRVLTVMREFLRPELPIGRTLVACMTAVNVVLDHVGVDPLRSPGLESPTTETPVVGQWSDRHEVQVDAVVGEIRVRPSDLFAALAAVAPATVDDTRDLLREMAADPDFAAFMLAIPLPTATSGLESRSTDRPVHDESLLDRAQAYVELGDLKTIARDKGWHKAFDWIVHHQHEADRVMVDYDPPPLDRDLSRCEKCVLQAEQRGVPYEEVFRANHDTSGAHVGPDTLPPEAVDVHVHVFEPTGSMDTGHSPPRRQWRCVCGETEWTDDPRGPEVTA